MFQAGVFAFFMLLLPHHLLSVDGVQLILIALSADMENSVSCTYTEILRADFL